MSNFFEEKFNLDEALYRRILDRALARGGDYCDLFFQLSNSNVIGLEDNEVNRAYRASDLGVGIRVLKDDATGYAFSEDLSPESMLAAADVAAAIANAGKTTTIPSSITEKTHPSLYKIQTPWSTVSTAARLPILTSLNRRVFSGDSAIQKVRVRLSDGESHVMVIDSEGRKSYDFQPMTTLYVAAVAQKGDRREENAYTVGGRHGLEFYSEQSLAHAADETVKRTMLLMDAIQPNAGEFPVVLAAGSSGILLHEAIGHGMEADFNRKRTSIYSESLNQPIAEPFVSIVDDGTVPSCRGSINVDDEGNATARTVLVENGVLRTYLHDRLSAKHYGVSPTGNGRRQSFRHMPLPRMRNTYMLPGPHTKDEIIRSVKRGIYAVTFTNGQVHIGAGDFTFYIKTGYLIEDGKLTAPIKDVNLIGNGPKVLRDTIMVGNDMELDHGGWTCGKDGQSVPVSLGMPTVKVKAITVGGIS